MESFTIHGVIGVTISEPRIIESKGVLDQPISFALRDIDIVTKNGNKISISFFADDKENLIFKSNEVREIE